MMSFPDLTTFSTASVLTILGMAIVTYGMRLGPSVSPVPPLP